MSKSKDHLFLGTLLLSFFDRKKMQILFNARPGQSTISRVYLQNHYDMTISCIKSSIQRAYRVRINTSKNDNNNATQDETPIKLDIFETAGTSQDNSKWEPKLPDFLANFVKSVDFSEPISFDGEEKTEYDPLRDGPLRYLGYANELGEAFAAWLFNGGVPLSYAIAIGYVLFDTVDKYNKTLYDATSKLCSRDLPPSVDVTKLSYFIGLERGIDTLIWQLIASVAAPGYTIHTVVALVRSIIESLEKQPVVQQALVNASNNIGVASSDAFIETFNKTIPTAAGLFAIPFIVHPIDSTVHAVLNATLRPAMRKYMCEEMGGRESELAVCDCGADGGAKDH